MKRIIVVFILLHLIGCNSEKTENQSKEMIVQALVKESVSKYIKNEAINDSLAYESISWGAFDSIQNPLSFKYKINHKYKVLTKSYTKNEAIDSIIKYDITFLLDSNFKITHVVETKKYADHFDNNGVSYKMFGGRELELIGIKNSFDMVFFENNKNRFLIVGGNSEIKSIPLMLKEKWVQMNLYGVSKELLNETDTIEHCLDLSGNDCKYYIFKEGKLNEEKIVQ